MEPDKIIVDFSIYEFGIERIILEKIIYRS